VRDRPEAQVWPSACSPAFIPSLLGGFTPVPSPCLAKRKTIPLFQSQRQPGRDSSLGGMVPRASRSQSLQGRQARCPSHCRSPPGRATRSSQRSVGPLCAVETFWGRLLHWTTRTAPAMTQLLAAASVGHAAALPPRHPSLAGLRHLWHTTLAVPAQGLNSQANLWWDVAHAGSAARACQVGCLRRTKANASCCRYRRCSPVWRNFTLTAVHQT
jgi:hypothetical protein